jgi:hypothetical protein
MRIICRIASGSRYFHIPEIDWSKRSRAKVALRNENSSTTAMVLMRNIIGAGMNATDCIPPK